MGDSDQRHSRKRQSTSKSIEATVEEVSGIVSHAVVEVGDAVSSIVESVADGFARRQRMTPAQRLVRKARHKRKEWRGHRNAYVVVNVGLVVLNVAIGVLTEYVFPWSIFPALGWGIGLAIHALNHRSWFKDNAQRLESAQHEVALLGIDEPLSSHASAPNSVPNSVGFDPVWSELLSKCNTEVSAAEASLSKSDNAVFTADTIVRLREGLAHLQRLAEGAATIQAAVKSVLPDGVDGLQARLDGLDNKIAATPDAKLAEVYVTNRALLAERRAKAESLLAEHDRMVARAEGFLFAVENIRLDASRVGAGAQGSDALSEPLRHLSEEVAILQQVEAELAEIH